MSTENKYNKEAQEKVRELAKDIKVAMMATNLGKTPLSAIPMTTQKIDVEGNIWFLSSKKSDHNQDIEKDNRVQLLYSDPSSMAFLSAYGKAEIHTDKSVLQDLYSSMADNWFDGIDDPDLTAIKVIPENAYYWDTKGNKLINIFKMGVAAATNEKTDLGKKGNLDV